MFIYEKTETEFKTQGLGTLVPISCIVQEELNGMYEVEFVHPYDKWKKWERIENERIVLVETPTGQQPFRIYNVAPTMENITINAKHIFYDLLDNFIYEWNGNYTAIQFLETIVSKFMFSQPFKFYTNIVSENKSVSVFKQNPIYLLLNTDTDTPSFFTNYGGEILRDYFDVKFLKSIGEDRGVQIRYSKNLVGLEVSEDLSDTVTRVFATGTIDGEERNLEYRDSPRINNYLYPKVGTVELGDCKDFDDMRAKVDKWFASGADLPKINIKVDFVLLGNTTKYKEFKDLERVQIGDIITVINTKMNFTKKAKVISYKWDSLLKRYDSVELGEFKDILTTSVTASKKSVSVANSANISASQALSLISGNVTIKTDYMYLPVDDTDYTKATKVYRLGKNGFEYSSTGYQGEFTVLVDNTTTKV